MCSSACLEAQPSDIPLPTKNAKAYGRGRGSFCNLEHAHKVPFGKVCISDLGSLRRVYRFLSVKLNQAATEPELYRYVMQSINVFEQAVASEMAIAVADCGTFGGAEHAVAEGEPGPQELADAIVSVWDKVSFAPLEDIVDR